jgi:NAD(P)-dependent dehydrogenase (short-subunit alcohol dehydrogenase family)
VDLKADLAGRCALITGASGGLGLHLAKVLSAAGCIVTLAARRMAVLERWASEINAAGGRAFAVSLDVRKRASVESAVAAAVAASGPIDILVNNSGVTVTASALDQTDEQWDCVLDTNLRGAYLVAAAVARTMRDSGREGSVINMASILGLRPAGRVSAYAVSKAGLIQLTRVLALEWARHSIRVNALAPGYIETDLNREFFQSAGAAMLARIPQRRLGRLEDLDGALLLLASDASRYMTGSVIAIDGGHLVSGL